MAYRYRPRPDSPIYNDMFAQHNTHIPVFNGPPDFPPAPFEHDSQQQQQQMLSSSNGFDSASYRGTSLYGNYHAVNRLRQPTLPTSAMPNPFPSDPSLSSFQPYNVTSPETYGSSAMNSEGGQVPRNFEYVSASNQSKSLFNNVDPFGNSVSSAGGLLQSQASKTVLSQQPHHGYMASSAPSNQTYINGVVTQSQTPYGPHITTNNNNGVSMGPGLNHSTSTGSAAQEEISTIFVVGFPDDMQEREFQNMFTFSAGFEAATLKIPNKDSTSYGSGNTNSGSTQVPNALRGVFGYPQTNYSVPSDQYNVVSLNQFGDSSWPPGVSGSDEPPFSTSLGSAGGHNNVTAGSTTAPRKQIIGFAKFRTRADALTARDTLQGRRVDIEKGAVLKAEMAKKNLHTKRGVGPLTNSSIPSVVTGSNGSGIQGAQNMIVPPESLSNMSNLSTLGTVISPVGEPLSARERELGTLGAMGLGSSLQRRERFDNQQEDEREGRRRRELGSLSLFSASRGPRERVEEEERERERKRKEKDMRLSATFEAFHSVNDAAQLRGSMLINAAQSASGSLNGALLSPSENLNSYPFPALSASYSSDVGGNFESWPDLRRSNNNGSGMMAISTPLMINSSLQSSSHSYSEANGEMPQPLSSQESDTGTQSAPYSPTMASVSVIQQTVNNVRQPRSFSPSEGDTLRQGSLFGTTMSSLSSSSSVTSSRGSTGSSLEDEVNRTIDKIHISTKQGSISPQLPSPGSGSSGVRSNGSDQNPPINTLYVGNLPTSPVLSGYPANHLEDSLRSLFQRCTGYRKLCFRQKSNGPMCFVEFDDVTYAAKALKDLYGHNLGGLVKGGIRLSYSKNPLGVRTPTTSTSAELSKSADMQSYDAQTIRGPAGEVGDGRSSIQMSFHQTTSPPPRFTSPSPSVTSHPAVTQQLNAGFTRAAHHGFGMGNISDFSPFGLPSPPHLRVQISAPEMSDALTASTPSIEAARAG